MTRPRLNSKLPVEQAKLVQGRVIVLSNFEQRVIDLTLEPMVLGRGRDVNIQLEDSLVSREHARIEMTSAGYMISDLGSHNGTKVNHQLIQAKILAHWDVIALGNTLLIFTDLSIREKMPPNIQHLRTQFENAETIANEDVNASIEECLIRVLGEQNTRQLMSLWHQQHKEHVLQNLTTMNFDGLHQLDIEDSDLLVEEGCLKGRTSGGQFVVCATKNKNLGFVLGDFIGGATASILNANWMSHLARFSITHFSDANEIYGALENYAPLQLGFRSASDPSSIPVSRCVGQVVSRGETHTLNLKKSKNVSAIGSISGVARHLQSGTETLKRGDFLVAFADSQLMQRADYASLSNKIQELVRAQIASADQRIYETHEVIENWASRRMLERDFRYIVLAKQ